jgi:hypothetical protein
MTTFWVLCQVKVVGTISQNRSSWGVKGPDNSIPAKLLSSYRRLAVGGGYTYTAILHLLLRALRLCRASLTGCPPTIHRPWQRKDTAMPR